MCDIYIYIYIYRERERVEARKCPQVEVPLRFIPAGTPRGTPQVEKS